jgi:hypothetical protein
MDRTQYYVTQSTDCRNDNQITFAVVENTSVNSTRRIVSHGCTVSHLINLPAPSGLISVRFFTCQSPAVVTAYYVLRSSKAQSVALYRVECTFADTFE